MRGRLQTFGRAALVSAVATLAMPLVAQEADSASVLIYDASGSMWGQLDGGISKVEIAREVIGDFFVSRDNSIPLGVIAYGHNRRGDCSDIEVVANVGVNDPAGLSTSLNRLNPRGMTPITDSLSLAASMIPPTAESADIILVTDGLETCDADPCALAAQLAEEGIAIRAHVVGFGLTNEETEAMACVADATGGLLLSPQTGQELADALNQVAQLAPAPAPEPELVANVLAQHFVFRDTGTGTPRGLMEWRAEGTDGTVLPLRTTEGTLQSIEGISAELPAGQWTIIAEGPEGRAERAMELNTCCGHHGIPFTGAQLSAEIPPLGQVQAGMGARIPFTITHAGSGNLGGTPYKIIATGPEGALTRDQIVRDDLITDRKPGTYGGSTGALEPGTYRLLVAIARQSGYEILAERTFEAVENPLVSIVGPDRAQPGEAISLSFDGGYATSYHFYVVDDDDRNLIQGRALYQGAGGGGGGPLSLDVRMPEREGVFDIVVRRDDEIIARKPIALGDAPAAAATQAAPGQDDLPMVPATFRLPPDYPQDPHEWSAIPLDPDMSPEAWAPSGKTVIGEGVFEPGRYEVTAAWGPKDTFRGVVEILPGQANDFVIPVVSEEDRDQVLSISGDWRVLAVPPRDAPPGSPDYPIVMAHVALMMNMAATAYEGLISPTEQMVGPGGADNGVALESVTEEEGYLFLRFSLPALSPAPFVLSLAPFGDGYAGTMDSAPNSLPVVFWPSTHDYPSMAEMQDVLYGPGPQATSVRSEDLDPVVFTCNEPSCLWTDPASGLVADLPQGWSVTEPIFFSAVGDNLPIDNPRMTFWGPGGAELRLNPHQWLVSNGPCIGTADLGELCQWVDADGPTQIAASYIAQGLQRGSPSAAAPIDGCDDDICFVSNQEFGIAAQLPRGWTMWQIERVDGALRAQFTNGASVLMLIPAANWNPENGPCLESAAGPLCYWAEGDPVARLAAPFIAANLAVDPAADQGGTAVSERAVSFTLNGESSFEFVSMEVRFETGSDPSGALPGDILYTMDGGLASLSGPFTIGNSYSFYATVNGRDYAARNIPIAFGSGPQEVTLAPLYIHGEVTLQLPGEPIVAGTGGYLPITFEAPADFAGSIALHDAYDRDAPPLFVEDGQWLLDVQDQVLPVPEKAGLYEVRFLDANGEMFGGVEFEALEPTAATSPSANADAARSPSANLSPGNDPSTMVDISGLDPENIVSSVMAQAEEMAAGFAAVVEPVMTPGEDTVTGQVSLAVGSGAEVALVTYSRVAPVLTPPEGADQATIDFMESVSGRTIHSASWTVVTGPIIVRLEAVETLQLRTPGMGVQLDFNLDPENLELIADSTNIQITPNTVEFLEYFDLDDPQIEISSLRTGSGNSMAMAGTFSGIRPDGIAFTGTFDIDAVTGSTLLQDILTGR